MRHARGLGCLATMLVAVALAGCSSSSDGAGEPGLYAVDAEGELQRLNGSAEWERETWPDRQNFPPDTHFVVRNPEPDGESGATGEPKISLSKVGWVRSEIRAGREIGPPQGRRWVAAAIPELQVPVRVVHDRPDVLMVAPERGALEPGLYALRLESAGGSELQARFGVGWSGIDEPRYAAAHCMDRYIENAATWYTPCARQRLATPTEGLQIRLVEPDRRAEGDKVTLVVKGTIANISQQARPIPMLQGQLKDGNGRVVHRWEFASPAPKLDPGAYVPFTTVASDVPATATDLTVTFQPVSRAALQ